MFEREASLDEFIEKGTILDATVTKELLYTIFIPRMENPLHDGAVISKPYMDHTLAVSFTWAAYLVVGSIVTAMVTGQGALHSASATASALSNVGPSLMPSEMLATFNPAGKLWYILTMIAGRLEILPLLLLLSRRTWKR